MSTNNISKYYTTFKTLSKEELNKLVDTIIQKAREKAYARRLRKNERLLQKEGDEFSRREEEGG